MKKKNILLAIFLGLVIFIFAPKDFAKAAYLTCGGDKTEADCVAVGGTVVDAGGCTVCKITSCPSGMKRYGDWTNFTSATCGNNQTSCDYNLSGVKICSTGVPCTTGSGWVNSRTLTCSFTAVGTYSNNKVVASCPGTCNSPISRLVYKYCSFYQGESYLVCQYFGTWLATCNANQTHIACIGSGVTPATAAIQGRHVLMPGNQEDTSIQTVSVLGGPSTAANPYVGTNLLVLSGATYTVSISERIGYSVGYTLCIDRIDCHDLTPTPGNTVSVTIPSGTGHYADLWWHYTPDPTLDFSLSPTAIVTSGTIFKSMSLNLYWTPNNATSCTASTASSGAGDWSGSMAFDSVTHSMSITPTETGTKTYNLECFNGATSSGMKTVTVDVSYGAVSCTVPDCGSDCGVVKKSYCQDTYGNIAPESDCGGGAGCDDVVCDSCQWKETAP